MLDGIADYGFVFFGIWWAWMNFTWFATSFDTDDWLYRVLTVLQMGGVLVFASGIDPAFEQHDYSVLVVAYVVMRVALVAQWLRAARWAGPTRRAARSYAAGISLVQVLWLGSLLLPAGLFTAALVVLIATAALWWIYFWPPHHHAITDVTSSLAYVYGTSSSSRPQARSRPASRSRSTSSPDTPPCASPYASFASTISLAVFVLGIWALAIRSSSRRRSWPLETR